MTEVRIRHEYEAEGALLADVPFGEVGDVIESLKSWGLNHYSEDGGAWVPPYKLSGQFEYNSVRDVAYFEIMIGEDE